MRNDYLARCENPSSIITAIDNAVRFPEILDLCQQKYIDDIAAFKRLVAESSDTAELLGRIRSKSFSAKQRMSLLKIFRRAVSPVLDTEMAKRIKNVHTDTLLGLIGHTFKPIELLKSQFLTMSPHQDAALAALIGEYDTRGQLGYLLTGQFFDWFEAKFIGTFSIDGPRGAGPDVELSTLYSNYVGSFPCDFVIRSNSDNAVRAIGFARYDATRGGGQADDRTGGNSDKVFKAKEFCQATGNSFRMIFLSDGPGMAHGDIWAEACNLDGSWDDNVRVTTLKTAETRIDPTWLMGASGAVVEVG